MVEKTKEELQAELDLLEKQNLERKIAAAKEESKKVEELVKKEAEEKLRKEIHEEEREKLVKELGEESRVEDGQEKVTNQEVLKNSKAIRMKYNGVKLNDIPGTPETKQVFVDDYQTFKKLVERDTKRMFGKSKELTGKTYEEQVEEMSMCDDTPGA